MGESDELTRTRAVRTQTSEQRDLTPFDEVVTPYSAPHGEAAGGASTGHHTVVLRCNLLEKGQTSHAESQRFVSLIE